MIENKILDADGVRALWNKINSTFIDETDLEIVINVIQQAIEAKPSVQLVTWETED